MSAGRIAHAPPYGAAPRPPLCRPHRGPARLGAWLLSHLLPAACAGCGARLRIDQRQGVCLACWRALEPRPRGTCARCAEPLALAGPGPECERCRRRPPPWEWARAVWEYAGPARGAVLAFKYGEVPGLAAPLAEAAVAAAGDLLIAPRPVLVPVPLHRSRARERGLDAPRELAREIGRRLGLRSAAALERPPAASTPQAGLGRAARLRNAERSFVLARPEDVFGRPAVLIDDVMTTGATATACARLLRGAGARALGVLVLARARLE